jgi:hypothetical protein
MPKLIGTEPNQVPTNGSLGNMAFQNKEAVSVDTLANALGAVGTPSYTFTGDTNTGMWSPAADTIAFSEGGVEVMRIDSNANVGIGTSSIATDASLQLHKTSPSAFTALKITNGATGTGNLDGFDLIVGPSSEAFVYNRENSFMVFGTNNTERMRLDTNGNLLVGTTSSSGSASNAARVIGGIFSTLRSSASVATNTATTIATLPSGEGNYMVSASLTNSSTPADYNEVAMVCVSGTTTSITVLANAAQLSLSMSGLNLQVTHLQGLTQTIQYSVLRIL